MGGHRSIPGLEVRDLARRAVDGLLCGPHGLEAMEDAGAGALVTMNQPSEKSGFSGAVVVDLARPVDIAEDRGEDARLARECGRGAEGSTAS